MNQRFDEDGLLRRYLLGQLSDAEREGLECQLLSEPTTVERLLIVEDELIESYARGELEASERGQFEHYFLPVPERQKKLRLVKALRKYTANVPVIAQPTRKQRSWWVQWGAIPAFRVAMAALLIVGLGLGIWRAFFYQAELRKGMAALSSAYRENRPLESRIAGFAYAPHSVTRGATPEKVDSLKRNLAERILLDLADKEQSPAALQALGKLHLANKQFADAIKQFEMALKAAPNNAQLHNDFGVALLEKGKVEAEDVNSGQVMVAFAQSLEHLNRALSLDGSLLEARFNRALLYQQMRLPQQAMDDWAEYLRRDAHSAWADEARQYRKAIEGQKNKVSYTKEQLYHEFLQAYQSSAHEKAWTMLSRNYDRTGNTIVEQLLDNYLELSAKGQPAEARNQLQLLSYAGELARGNAGDHFIAALARFYQLATPQQRQLLARARGLMKSGHACSDQAKDQQAVQFFLQARQFFDQLGDRCEALFANYWLGLSYYFNNQKEQSSVLQKQVAIISEHDGYKWLRVRALYGLSIVEFSYNEHSKAVDYAVKSLNLAQQISDTIGELNALSSLIEYQRYLGNQRQSLTYIQRSLPLLDLNPPNVVRDWRHYGFIALAFNYFGLYAAALDYEKAALRVALPAGDIAKLTVSYAWLGLIYGQLQNYHEALKNIQHSIDIAQPRVQEPSIRILVAYSNLQLGHVYRQMKEFDQAVSGYSRAIELYNGLNAQTYVYQAHKGRLLCYQAQQQEQSAKAELETTLALAEKYRTKIFEEESRHTFFDIEQSVYDLAVDFARERLNDPQKAFEYSEDSKARSLLDLMNMGAQTTDSVRASAQSFNTVSRPLTLAEIRQRIPEQAQLVQYEVLEDKLLIWLVSSHQFFIGEKKIARNELEDKVLNYLRIVSSASNGDNGVSQRAAKELFSILITPVELALDKGKALYLVPDKILNYLPYGALISPESGRCLIEDYVLALAPSSSIFINCSARAKTQANNTMSERLLSVGDPAFDQQAFPQLPRLSAARQEAAEVAASYQGAQLLLGGNATEERVTSAMAHANVVHLASHALADERSPLRSKLVLAKGETNGQPAADGLLQALEIYRLKLPQTRLVILSACQTGVERYYQGEGMVGLARPFLAAGVPLVVASLWPIDSPATAALMVNFHSYRKRAGLPTAAALRRAQLEMLGSSERRLRQPYYWAGLAVIGGHTSF